MLHLLVGLNMVSFVGWSLPYMSYTLCTKIGKVTNHGTAHADG